MLDEAEPRLAKEQRRGWLRASCSCCPVAFSQCSATAKVDASSLSASLPAAALAQKSQQRCWIVTILIPASAEISLGSCPSQ